MNWKLPTLITTIVISLLGAGAYLCFKPEQKNGATDIQLTEIPLSYKVLETKNYHYFRSPTGEVIQIEATDKEMSDLALPDASQPTKKGYVWISSGTDVPTKYSTSTTELNDYEFMYLETSSTVKIKLPDKDEKEINSEYIKDKKLTTNELKEI